MGSRYMISPVGEFEHPWVNKADTKFNADGLFHTKHNVPVQMAQPVMDKIEAAAKAFLAEHTDSMSPGEAKKWGLQLPFEEVLDEETGEPTGDIQFTYKQNAKIKTKDGGVKHVNIEVRDGEDKIVTTSVWSGDKGRVMFTMRGIVISSTKKAGIRLDFAKVQITEKGRSGMSDAGFGAVEGGYVAPETSADDYEASEGDEEAGDY